MTSHRLTCVQNSVLLHTVKSVQRTNKDLSGIRTLWIKTIEMKTASLHNSLDNSAMNVSEDTSEHNSTQLLILIRYQSNPLYTNLKITKHRL